MTWFVFSLLSIFALASAELFQQRLLNAKQAFSERTSAVLTFGLQSVLAFVVVFVTPLRTQLPAVIDRSLLPRLLLVTLIGAIGSIFYFRSFKVKSISLSTIFISGSVIVSTLLGWMFFHEPLTLTKVIGIALVLGAIAYANFKNAFLEKNHLFGLAAAVCFGMTYTLDKSLVATTLHPLVYIAVAFAFTGLWVLLTSAKEVIQSIRSSPPTAFIPIVCSGVGYFFYNVFTFSAYRFGGEVGKVDAINNSQIFLIILFEFFILKQKQSLRRKFVAAIIAIAGVLLLGLIN